MIHLNSRISSVTVFGDRAQIVRTAELELGAGEHHLVFDKLPSSMIQDSFQISAQGAALLSNIRFKESSGLELSEQNINIIEEERQRILDNVRTFGDKLNRLMKEKSFVESIADKLTAPSQESQTVLDADKWMQMINFYHEKLKKIDAQILEVEKANRTWENKLKHFESEVERLGAHYNQTTRQIHFNILMKSAGTIVFQLSYLVSDATWKPCYDLRVSSDQKMMHISYNALVWQNTTEDWEDVSIQLSTGQPGMSGEQPQLSPWSIEIFKPVYKPGFKVSKSPFKEQIGMVTTTSFSPQSLPENWAERHTAEKIPPMPRTASLTFKISGLHSIKSDQNEHLVNIMIEKFPADFQYSSVPKLSPFAYLKARVINHTEYPFLAGETFIFLDNQFVAGAHIKTIAPQEEFWTSIGVDTDIPVERKFLKKYENKQEETDQKMVNMTYEYQIHIRNHKDQTEEIVVWDQLPISHSDEIKVELLAPRYEEDTENLQKNKSEYLKWLLKVKPGEETIIPFKFSVKYPREENVIGLD
ncbi:MAG: mucoidy inhibitor MuiA family protein [Microscillaceae bacterium]|nr:mucoidy inhibitor MuiA family protein [Microscillaceae bacterium]